MTWSWSTLVFCSRTMIQNTTASRGWRNTKRSLGSGRIKVLTWFRLRCCNVILKWWFLLKNSPVWLDYNSAKTSGPSAVITKVWLQWLLLRVDNPVIRLRWQSFFYPGTWRFGLPSLKWNIFKKKTKKTQHFGCRFVIFVSYLNELRLLSATNMQPNKKGGKHRKRQKDNRED